MHPCSGRVIRNTVSSPGNSCALSWAMVCSASKSLTARSPRTTQAAPVLRM